MSELKKLAQTLNTNAEPRDIKELIASTNNIYETLAIISKRSRQISTELKKELQEKLSEFATNNENLDEVMENKEQIEISRFYERLPNPSLIATSEFLQGKLHYERNEDPQA